jgi:hypothetical protein
MLKEPRLPDMRFESVIKTKYPAWENTFLTTISSTLTSFVDVPQRRVANHKYSTCDHVYWPKSQFEPAVFLKFTQICVCPEHSGHRGLLALRGTHYKARVESKLGNQPLQAARQSLELTSFSWCQLCMRVGSCWYSLMLMRMVLSSAQRMRFPHHTKCSSSRLPKPSNLPT